MLVLLSPAKTLDFESQARTENHSTPRFSRDSGTLIRALRALSPAEISRLMKISDKLAHLNAERYAQWRASFKPGEAKQALLAFKGDVYLGLAAETYSERDFTFAQKHLRILSGLHGVLRPLDLIHPYRLEMGTKLATQRGDDLYGFWGSKVSRALNDDLAELGTPPVINLASNEYCKVVDRSQLQSRVIDVRFLDWKNGQYKFMSFFAKKARGLMASYIVQKRVKSLKAARGFDWHGYAYDEADSTANEWVFKRSEATDYRG